MTAVLVDFARWSESARKGTGVSEINVEEFYENYLKSLREGTAALFAGLGSRVRPDTLTGKA